MEPTKVCSRCGGAVDVETIREERSDGTYRSYVVGTCRACGTAFNEAEVLALDGPGPVGA